MPMTPFRGVRISWLIVARNSAFAWLAASASCLALRSCPSTTAMGRLDNRTAARKSCNASMRSTVPVRGRTSATIAPSPRIVNHTPTMVRMTAPAVAPNSPLPHVTKSRTGNIRNRSSPWVSRKITNATTPKRQFRRNALSTRSRVSSLCRKSESVQLRRKGVIITRPSAVPEYQAIQLSTNGAPKVCASKPAPRVELTSGASTQARRNRASCQPAKSGAGIPPDRRIAVAASRISTRSQEASGSGGPSLKKNMAAESATPIAIRRTGQAEALCRNNAVSPIAFANQSGVLAPKLWSATAATIKYADDTAAATRVAFN